ncbi:MAG: DedA family protein [Bacteroidales bacterium]|jgi:membrane protein DedA with SNARE-associated domain|nr:DedA family protein [Bacteroidales bacterium]HPF00953.1 DedA family protein [Bacteroidales bacterium]
MGITEKIALWATAFIASTGYVGIFVLMVMESMVLPVPSEAVMPFAGFNIVDGNLTWAGVIIASTLGSIVGSLISYYIGYYGGKPFIARFGKYLLLNQHHLELSEKFFAKRGEITILIARFIPIVRHLISIPAGFGKMNIPKFILFTTIGAGIWNAFLTWVGFVLRENWSEVMKYSHVIDIVVLVVLGGAALFYLYKIIKSRKTQKNSAE